MFTKSHAEVRIFSVCVIKYDIAREEGVQLRAFNFKSLSLNARRETTLY